MGIDSAISQITRTRKPCSFALLKKAEIDVNAFYRPTAATTNVVGMLPGTDSRISDELIVIGASLDGVGMQGETCLFPGADINASGVAAVLETARLLSKPDYRPKRSVVFVLFSGSEQQFLGSRVFLENYTKLRKIEAFLNVQNIGCGDSIVLLGDIPAAMPRHSMPSVFPRWCSPPITACNTTACRAISGRTSTVAYLP